MLRTLDLIWTLAKYCLWLTLAKLASTALGWEFGISRQYLRLLEWLLQLGEERIERCESEHRLQREHAHEQEPEREPAPPLPPPWDASAANGRAPERRASLERARPGAGHEEQTNGLAAPELTRAPGRQRRPGTIRFCQPATCWSQDDLGVGVGGGGGGALSQSKRRRVSTPDGPPVFLLDDDFELEEPEDDNQEQEQCEQREQELRRSGCDAKSRPKRHEFHLNDATRLVARGLGALIDDEVTKRFTPEQLKSWNLLTRTNAKNYQFMSRSLGLCWLCGLVTRYALLLPLRIMFTLVGFAWLVATMSLVGLLPRNLRAGPYRLSSLMSFRMLSCGITSRLQFHNRQWRAQRGDICVANHTSPIDVVLLACDNCYALVGQRHGGLLGVLEVALSRATNHVWFDRAESRDRKMAARKLSEHVALKSNLPVLIFPEGTCINNSAVMRFSKGIFGLETTARVCPVAIKYDPRFGDPFWCSSRQSYIQYLLMMMSSWAIKCDVWYLPPMERRAGESAAEFADRVKGEIARQAGLEDLAWDGQLKRTCVKPAWLYQQQEDYAKRLKLE